MADYREMYITMFRAAELAVREIEQGNSEKAVLILKMAQLRCEELYIETAE